MEALQQVEHIGVLFSGDAGDGGAFEREAHLDVGGGEGIADEVALLGEDLLPVVEVGFELGVDVLLADDGRDGFEDGPGQYGALAGKLVEDEFEHERGHGGAFRVVHPVAVLEEFVAAGIRAQALAIGLCFVRWGAVVVQDVFDDGGGFGDGVLAVGKDGGFA